MAISVLCKSCGKRFSMRDEMAGKLAQCSNCGTEIIVPAAEEYMRIGSDGPLPTNEPSVSPAGRLEPMKLARTNISGLAITSLVLGIMGIVTGVMFIGIFIGLVGVILGAVATSQIRNSNGKLHGRGLAIGGICTGAAAMLFTVFFVAAIVLPTLTRSREEVRKSVCKGNLKTIGLSVILYAGDWSDEFPTTGVEGDSEGSLSILFSDYQPNTKLFTCPSTSDLASTAADTANFRLNKNEVSYYYVNGLSLAMPPDTPIAWDHKDNHKGGERNVLYVGGHVTRMSEANFQTLLKEFELSEKGTTINE